MLKRLRLVAWLVAVVTIVLLEVVLSTWPEAVPPISNPLSVCAGGGVAQLLLQGRVPVIALAAVVLAMNLNSGHMVDMAAVGVGVGRAKSGSIMLSHKLLRQALFE